MAKVKLFFVKVGRWFKNHAPTKRRLIQIYAALLYNANIKGFVTGKIYQGNTKKACVPGFNCYSCPGAIGACPLGSLQDSLANSGNTAPYYIIGILGLFGLMFARTICGFLCPVGLGQELLYKIKTPKLKKSRYTRLASYLKYVLLAVFVIAIPLIYHGIPAFCKYICPAGTFGGAGGLLSNPNNASLYDQLGYLFTWKFLLLVVMIVASVFIFRFFCRFICPLGAIYGFFNRIALIGVKLDTNKCVDCGMCLSTCKMDIRHVGDHECINCGECIPVCPTKAISWKGSKLVLAGIDTSVLNETVSLKSMVSGGEAKAVQTEDTTATQTSEISVTVDEGSADGQESEEIREDKIKAVEAKIKKRGFWLQVGAWALALLTLAGALIYYNVIDKAVYSKTYTVGDTCPDYEFTTVYQTAGAEVDGGYIESVKLFDLRGTVTVLNFWYTLCDPCIEELPDFNEAKERYGDSVNVVVIHINNSASDKAVQTKIDGLGWGSWNVMFVHDIDEDCFTALGGKAVCPMTVVLDKDGEITFSYIGNLKSQVYNGMPLLNYEIESAMNK